MVSPTHIWTLLILVTACGNVTERPTDAAGGPTDTAGGPIDAPGTQARCDPTKPFGAPTLVPNINSSLDEESFSLTRDETTAFVTRYQQTSGGPVRTILSTQRASADASFSIPNANSTSAINAGGNVWGVSSSSDGLTLYISRQTGTQFGIFIASRAAAGASFDAGTLGTLSGTGMTDLFSPVISTDGQTLYFGDLGFTDVLSATRLTNAATFGNKRTVASVQGSGILSTDELTMFYFKGDSAHPNDVMMATRTNKTGTFGTGTAVANVNSAANDTPVALTYDGCVLYISSDRPGGVGGLDIWEAHRPL